jgi:4-oxalocrotonate tautomerase
MPLVNVELAEGVYTEKQKHDMAARLTDVMVAFEGSEVFREVVWVLIEELHRDGWHVGGKPFFGPPTLMGALGRLIAAYEAIDAPRSPVRAWPPRPLSAPMTRRGAIRNRHVIQPNHAPGQVARLHSGRPWLRTVLGRWHPEDDRCVARDRPGQDLYRSGSP